ncbi:plastocyanin/azurin family copper-binding protein [Haladaptatus sp. GCM10025707]|uniref:cupredoxin domain-containing protein n=1 Tax=unclassified Haladaptatus TaxID=2622732 RepID=UPI0023E7DA9C|nr:MULTISPECIES: plastocyanin/azurin family copper-binding protein [unclassified Haladaptatus]
MVQTTTRRRLLQSSGLLFVAATAGCTGGGSDDGGGDGAPAASFTLGGETSGWQGQSPDEIAETTNPTLQLTAGETYELTWENLDGMEHELIIEDGSRSELEATESNDEKGATESITFEATSEMASYYCEYHPEQMRGSVEVSEE